MHVSTEHAENKEIVFQLRQHLTRLGYAQGTIDQRCNRLLEIPAPLTRATQADVLASLPPGASPKTKRVYVSAMSSGFRELMNLGLVHHNPTQGIRLPSAGRSVPRPLTDEQLATLMAGRGPERSWTILGAYAGLRSAEVTHLYAEDLVHTQYGQAIEVTGKGNVKALIPAHPHVVSVFANGPSHGPLWRMRPDSMSGRWSAWAGDLGLPGLRFHQLRHTYGTRLYQQTQDLLLTAEMMRHSNINTTTIYAKLADNKGHAAVVGL
jgi:integrase/recombinase XerC